MSCIAIVDDDPDVGEPLMELFRLHGHQAVYLNGDENVVDALRELRPALLLLDVNMPKISGIEVYLRLRTDEVMKAMPVVMYSGNPDPEIEAKVRQWGVRDFVLKTMDFTELLGRIERHLPE